uniref:Short-chain dehydrogenase/reductase 3 n=1 Tax=Timema genevievae TaxID=629358 RepID=A0A7R9JYU8_TIMGE|nr:unnamed protein product [Timema genevievae]
MQIENLLEQHESEAKEEITGTGHGIGKELALQFAMLGSTVVCWDINEDNNKKTVDELGHLGYKAHAYNCDVSSREQVFKIAREVKEKVGDVTVVVNNAGIMPCHPFMAHNSQEIQRIFDINVMAHFWMLEAFLPSMINKNHGHIVALSSMAGLMGIANLVPYCASKYAVRGLMEAMAEELREGNHQLDVKFTTICPFIVDTGLCKKPRTRWCSAPTASLYESSFLLNSFVEVFGHPPADQHYTAANNSGSESAPSR